MSKPRSLIGVGVLLAAGLAPCAGFAATICSRPVPMLAAEILRKQAAGKITDGNAQIALLKSEACREAASLPQSDYTEDVGRGCTMFSGMLNDRRVYWETCGTAARSPPVRIPGSMQSGVVGPQTALPNPRPNARPRSGASAADPVSRSRPTSSR